MSRPPPPSSSSSTTPKVGRQTTLLQTWGYNKSKDSKVSSSVFPGDEDVFGGEDGGNDEEDEMLSRAMEESVRQFKLEEASRSFQSMQEEEHISPGPSRRPPSTSTSTSLSVDSPFRPGPSGIRAAPTGDLSGFDRSSGDTWVYPTNYPERKYQFDIVRSALYRNTLVTLPTGLGKTFIAAVVMYNFFRWYPNHKVIFMAPTKPLVAQQIEACFRIMGIPQVEMMEMTGEVRIKLREKAWQQKRVLFMTPHIMSNDLNRGLFPADKIKLVVVDEAHKAQGDYAYCQVVKELNRHGTTFRVLALSATPGTDLNNVKLMLQNLGISRIELRSEESPDILPYTHERTIQKVVVPLGQELLGFKRKFLEIVEIYVGRLVRCGALSSRGSSRNVNPEAYSKYGLIMARNEFRQNPPRNIQPHQQGPVEGDFASAISLFHACELLVFQGTRAFRNFMGGIVGPDSKNRKLRFDLGRNPNWLDIRERLDAKFSGDADNSVLNCSVPCVSLTQGGEVRVSQVGSDDTQQQTQGTIPPGHPKGEKLKELVLDHFRKTRAAGAETRVMIFSQYRDSVTEIAAVLRSYRPLVKVMQFVGQAGTKGKKGLTQKEQMEVVRKFREGGFNTLVATCVGEEGLDIGEVDLIVCYDVSKSPIRLVQRMGRTGRKRAGRIVVLVSEGKEEQTYNASMSSRNSINKAILDKDRLSGFLVPSPRMVPGDLEPKCLKMVMEVRSFSKSADAVNSVAPEGNQRISCMLKSATGSTEDGGKKKAKKREAKQHCQREAKKKKFKEEDQQPVMPDVIDLTQEDNKENSPGAKNTKKGSKVDLLSCLERIEAIPDTVEEGGDLSDLEAEVVADLAARIERDEEGRKEEEEESLTDFVPPRSWEDWDGVPLPGWMVGDDGEACEAPFSPIRAPPESLGPPSVPCLSADEFAAQLQKCREKYRKGRRGGGDRKDKSSVKIKCKNPSAAEERKVAEDDDVFGDDFEFDMSEWNPDDVDAKKEKTKVEEDEQEPAIPDRSPPRNSQEAPDVGDFSPILLTQWKHSRNNGRVGKLASEGIAARKTSTPNVFAGNGNSVSDTPKRPTGRQEDDFKAAAEMLLDDGSFGAAPAGRSAADTSVRRKLLGSLVGAEKKGRDGSLLYTATQLTSFVNRPTQEKPPSQEQQVQDQSGKTEESDLCGSNEDLFRSEDDAMFLGLDDQLGGTNNKFPDRSNRDSPRGAPFKLPNLDAFEAAVRTPPAVYTPRTNPPVASTSTPRTATASTSVLSASSSSSTKSPLKSPQDEDSLLVPTGCRRARFPAAGVAALESTREKEEESSPEIAAPRNKGSGGGRIQRRFSGSDSSGESSNISPPVKEKSKKRKRQTERRKNNFVVEEAEMSDDHDDDFSDDSEAGSDLDKMEGSFVDDVSMTQGVCTQQHANYLRSVRSPPVMQPRRRLPPITADIYSQPVRPGEEEEDSYRMDDEDDSFVAGDGSSDVEEDSRLDTLDLIEEGDRTCVMSKEMSRKKRSQSKKIIARGMASSSEEEEEAPTQMPAAVPVKKPRMEKVHVVTPPPVDPDSGKEARLRRQRELQEQFRQRRAEAANRESSDSANSTASSSVVSRVVPNGSSFARDQGPLSTSSYSSANAPEKKEERPTVVVSTSDVHKIPELISELKHTHKLQIHVRFLDCATVLASPRMGIDRRMVGDFFNEVNRARVAERCQRMNDLFERPCVILESERPSEDGVVPRSVHVPGTHRTKYVDTLLSQLSGSKIHVLFSENQTQTASIVAALVRRETKKGQSFPRPLRPTEEQERAARLCLSLPGVSAGAALLMATGFPSLAAMASAARATLMRKAGLDEEKAGRVVEFLRRRFRQDLYEGDKS